jgi:hypothetical protein
VRTALAEADRHRGFSQMILDLKAPGVTIRPVINLAGEQTSTRSYSTACSCGPTGWSGRKPAAGPDKLGHSRYL